MQYLNFKKVNRSFISMLFPWLYLVKCPPPSKKKKIEVAIYKNKYTDRRATTFL